MKALAFMLLLLIATSCAVTFDTSVPCWKQRICVGDTYRYDHAPRIGGGFYVTQVQIITIRGNQCLIRHENGRETWVDADYFDHYSSPINIHRQHDNGKHKGQYK